MKLSKLVLFFWLFTPTHEFVHSVFLNDYWVRYLHITEITKDGVVHVTPSEVC